MCSFNAIHMINYFFAGRLRVHRHYYHSSFDNPVLLRNSEYGNCVSIILFVWLMNIFLLEQEF